MSDAGFIATPPNANGAVQSLFDGPVGATLIMIVMLAVIIKYARMMRRPETQKLGALSFVLAIGGGWISAFTHTFLVGREGFAPYSLILGLLAAALLLAAFVISIVSLATFDRSRHQLGRILAVMTLLMTSFLGLYAAGMYVKRMSGLGFFAAGGATSTVIEQPAQNFAAVRPSYWVSVKPEVINKDATLAFVRSGPEMYCLVFAESGARRNNSSRYADDVKAYLASAAKVLDQTQTDEMLDGRPFVHVVSRARLNDTAETFVYESWRTENKGYVWQIILWSKADYSEKLSVVSRQIAQGFRVLDPLREATASGKPVEDVERPALGYSTHLEKAGWQMWETPDSANVLTDFRAGRASDALIVTPVRLPFELPDLPALARAFLNTLSFEYPDEEQPPGKTMQTAVGDGLEIVRERKSADGINFVYVLRVVRGADAAYLLAGWADKTSGDVDAVRRGLDAVELSKTRGDPPTLSATQSVALAKWINQVGLSYYQREDFVHASLWFQRASERRPDQPVYLTSFARAIQRTEEYGKGLDYLAARIGRFREDAGLNMQYARLQVLAGKPVEAAATFSAMIDFGLTDESRLSEWLNFLLDRKLYVQAQASADAWVAKHPTVGARRWQADVLVQSGDPAHALELLEKLSVENPDDETIQYQLGTTSNRAGKYERSEAIARRFLAANADDMRALRTLGWSQMGQKHQRDAKYTFEKAAKLKPDDDSLKEAIRDASAALGQGSNSELKTPITSVSMPAEVSGALTESSAEDLIQGQSMVVLRRTIGYFFEPGKPIRHTLRRRIKVLTSDGLKELSTLKVSFDPVGEHIFVNRLQVQDAAGKVLKSVGIDDAYLTDVSSDLATHRKVLNVPIPGLAPGLVVDSEISFENFEKASTFEFTRHLFAHGAPTRTEAIYVVGKPDLVKFEVERGEKIKTVSGEQFRAWVAKDLPAEKSESFAVSTEERRPMLWLGGIEGDWKKVANDYLKQIDNRLKPEPDVIALAGKLTAGLKTEHEKIAVLAREVQKSISYKAIEFGVRARQPNEASKTLSLRYGDCKDHGLLLYQLLRAAGVSASLALVNTEWRTQQALPTLDQFNHLVVLVPALGADWLVDTTDKQLPLDDYPADGLWNSHALILDPANPRLLQPMREPVRSSLIRSRRTLTADGSDWQVDETILLQGYYAAWLRRSFAGLDKAERDAKAQQMISGQAGAELKEFRFDAVDDPARPAQLQLSYRVRDAITLSDGQASAQLPGIWEKQYLETNFVKDRLTDFRIRYPLQFESEVSVKLPVKVHAQNLAALAAKAAGEFTHWELRPESGVESSDMAMHFRFASTPGRFAADRYQTFHDDWDAAARIWDRRLIWSR